MRTVGSTAVKSFLERQKEDQDNYLKLTNHTEIYRNLVQLRQILKFLRISVTGWRIQWFPSSTPRPKTSEIWHETQHWLTAVNRIIWKHFSYLTLSTARQPPLTWS